MHYSFAASILYNNPAKLQHLTLDNLQQVGKGCDHFLYRRANQRHDYLQSPSVWNQMIGQYGPQIPFGPAGPMQNLLGPLAGRCQNLRTLKLRKVGQRDQIEFTPEFGAKDEDIYREFAHFIHSVKSTLQHVVFEQGENIVTHAPVRGPPRPMDVRFWNILGPQLFQGPWQCLESMDIGGVHTGWTGDPHFTTKASSRGNFRARWDVKAMYHVGLGDPLAGRFY